MHPFLSQKLQKRTKHKQKRRQDLCAGKELRAGKEELLQTRLTSCWSVVKEVIDDHKVDVESLPIGKEYALGAVDAALQKTMWSSRGILLKSSNAAILIAVKNSRQTGCKCFYSNSFRFLLTTRKRQTVWELLIQMEWRQIQKDTFLSPWRKVLFNGWYQGMHQSTPLSFLMSTARRCRRSETRGSARNGTYIGQAKVLWTGIYHFTKKIKKHQRLSWKN